MSIAVVTLIALAIAIVVSCFSPINIGFLAIGLASLIGYVYGLPFKTIVQGFPLSLFIILTGVTLLFSQANVNGTLSKLTHKAMRLAKGRVGLLPIIIFFLTWALSSIGPGNIAMIALMSPIAMAVAGDARINPVMMTIMIVNGANAGAFSPISPTGIISAALTDKIGLPDIAMKMFMNNLWANFAIGMGAYLLFGGLKLWKNNNEETENLVDNIVDEPFNTKQWITLGSILLLVISVIFFKFNVGLAAFIIATTLSITGVADEEKAVKAMPWNAIVMVCGVSLLMGFVESTGGLDLFTSLLAKFSTPGSVTGVLGFICGLISAYSSSSGVVMPAFLPLIPGLIAKMGGGDPLAMASAINVGAHVVDASPLSVGGALCIGCAAAWVDKKKMFRDLMIWGLSMSVVGAITVWLLFTVLGL